MGNDMGDEQHVEQVVLSKVNARLLPLFFMVALLCQLDRSNLSFAALQMDPQLGFSKTIHGLGSGLFFIGYLAQLPANMACVAVGARKWLSGILVVWGCVAMCFATVRGVTLFLVLRLLLGVAESGAYPGMYYHLSLFYKDSHLGVAYTWVATATAVAGLLGGPLAAGLMSLDGKLGLRGWQWLFVVEGIPPIVLALVLYLRLPTSPLTASFLQSEERAWLWRWVHGRDDGIELAPVRLLPGQEQLASAEEGGGAAVQGMSGASPDGGGGGGSSSSGCSFSSKHTEEVEKLFPRSDAAVSTLDESSQPGQALQPENEQRRQQQSLLSSASEAASGSAPAYSTAMAREGAAIEGAPLLDSAPNSQGRGSRSWDDNPGLTEHAPRGSHAVPGSHASSAALATASEAAAAQFKAPRVDDEGSRLSRHILRQGLADWRVWWLGGVMFSVDFAMNSTHFWLPMLIKGMLPGYKHEDDEEEGEAMTSRQVQLHQVVAASLLAALPFAGAGVCMVANAYSAKRHRERRLHTAIPLGVAGCAFGLVVPLSHWLGLWPALGSLTLAAAGIWATHGPLFSWPAQFLEPRAGALAFALMKTLGALGGFSGPLAVGVLADEDGGFGGAMLLLAVVCGVTGAVVAVFPPESRPEGKPRRLWSLLQQLSRSFRLRRYDQLASLREVGG